VTDTKRDVAWRKYVSTCQLGGTREQRLWAFRAWLALEQKDMAAERARVRRAQKASASS
jgi:hypothetical protein